MLREEAGDAAMAAATEAAEAAVPDVGLAGEEAGKPEAAEAVEALAAPAAPVVPMAAAAVSVIESEIEALLDFRTFKRGEQWRVRWRGGDESWEAWACLDTATLRQQAAQLRDGAAEA